MNAVADNAVTEMPAPLVFSDNAAGKVKQLIEEEGNPELKLRVFVTGGGCSGFQYGFTFDEVRAPRAHRPHHHHGRARAAHPGRRLPRLKSEGEPKLPLRPRRGAPHTGLRC